MTLMLRLQVLAIAVAAASILFVHVWLGAIIPARELAVFDAIMGGFVAWWIVSILWLRARGSITPDTPDSWYWHTSQVFWFGNAATVSTYWLALPYGSEAMRLMVTMMCLAPITVEVLGTIRPPKFGPRGLAASIVPVGIPIGIGSWFALSHDEFRLPMVLFLASFTAVMLLLREVVQGSVDEAWRAKQAAEAARDARTRFLASASHDLGQPLQAARLFFDQARASPAGPAHDKAVRGVHWAFDATEQLLGQMLDHLRLESGQVRAEVAVVPLGPLIARAAEMHEPAARLAGAEIIAMPTALVAAADRTLTERALGNLVGNAVRHAKARRLLVGARRRGTRLRLWVIDDGTGIPADDLARLFQDHVQGSNHGDEVRGGFGLGLASTRRMAELMGGSAGIDTRWRRGSAFWVELPEA